MYVPRPLQSSCGSPHTRLLTRTRARTHAHTCIKHPTHHFSPHLGKCLHAHKQDNDQVELEMPQNLAVTISARSQNNFVFTLSLVMTSFKGPPLSWTLLHFLLLLLYTTSTHGSTESWHYEVPFFVPPDPSRPCRHAFRDDPETSALLADFVVIGHPTPTYQHTSGVLYNASVLVEQVLKRPRLSIYPVREGFPILTGPFSQWTDLGRCWINVHSARKYIFFIDRPNWAGFFRISHLPLFYTTQRWQKIRTILKHPRELTESSMPKLGKRDVGGGGTGSSSCVSSLGFFVFGKALTTT